MFILHSSNKTENLVEHLAIVLKSAVLSSPLAEELFLIQSQGMERWLSQQLAEHFKVWGNFSYQTPGKFFSKLTGILHPAGSGPEFDRHFLFWRIEAQLRDIDATAFQPLQNYLSGENIELKRYQLAQQLARIFDQYQMLRPDLLEAWRQGHVLYQTTSEQWQFELWRALGAKIGPLHRGELWRQTMQRLQQATPGELAEYLPERLTVFGINSMPPLLLAYLQALSKHCDIHLYLLNPVQGYWADLPGKRLLAQLAEFDGHPLLVALGQQGREFQQLLLEQVEFAFEPSSFEAQTAENVLQQLQNDILANQVPQINLVADDSISIHACHSRLREVQVLKNQLLAALEKHPRLELRDIVVMAPDIQLYAPFISAIFADVQHAIADRSLRVSNTALKILVQFLQLSQSRLGWQSVLDLFEQPLVYTNFGLNSADMELIRHWITDTQVRWGRSAAHKQTLDLPPLQQNTWQATLDRLFIGYAVGIDAEFVDDILPYIDIEGTATQALGGLNDFLQLLFKTGEELQSAKPLAAWQALLKRYADELLTTATPLERQSINQLLKNMADAVQIHNQPLTLAVILAWLDGRMEESLSGNGFLRGQLTFCSMLPMRSIPFQVIALLGMNDGEFPKIEHNPSFDLLSQQPRLGDRSRRADDRYQFLEILLSARLQLLITYTGLSQRDNSEIPPSVAVSELLEVLSNCYGLSAPVIRHPLHPFSPRYFDDSHARLFSYQRHDFETANRLGRVYSPATPWWQGEIAAETGAPIAIAELLKFYNHPQRYFLQQQLGIQLLQLNQEAEEREPFSVDNLSLYGIQQSWIAAALKAKELPLSKLQAQGCWPAGALGELLWHKQLPELEKFVETLLSKDLGEQRPALAVDLTIGGFRLIGKLDHLYANGNLLYRYGTLKGKDFVAAWLQHLLINCIERQATYLLSKDQILLFPAKCADSRILAALLEIFQQGKQRPDAFFTEAAFCFLQQKKPETALNAVCKQFLDSIENGYEPEISQLFANCDINQLINADFARQCQSLLLPGWSAAHAD
jgi:exodeoxyribonuclease V gamma subunit